jgi:hypothetical protein
MDVCKSCSSIIEPGTLRLSPLKVPLLFPSYLPSNCTFPMPRDYISRQRERLLLATSSADRLGHALYQVGAFFGRSAFGRSAFKNANIHYHVESIKNVAACRHMGHSSRLTNIPYKINTLSLLKSFTEAPSTLLIFSVYYG